MPPVDHTATRKGDELTNWLLSQVETIFDMISHTFRTNRPIDTSGG
jgi:hypothetical protein